MLFKQRILEGIARGDVALAFRRWKRKQIRPGSRLRTAIGEVLIGQVEPMEDNGLTEADARKAGHDSLAALMTDLNNGDGRVLYRIELGGIAPDERTALRNESELGTDETARLVAKLAPWDRVNGKDGYHLQILRLIAAAPSVPAADLAERLGIEKPKFKRDVRKLKELGLTESLKIGYRLSPRGDRFLALADRETP